MGVKEATEKTAKVRTESPPPTRVRIGSELAPTPDSAELRRGRPLPGAGSRWATAALGTDWAGRAEEGRRGQLWAEDVPAAGSREWAVEAEGGALEPGLR